MGHSHRRLMIITCFVLMAGAAIAAPPPPPVNDNQCTATLLTMPSPAACPSWAVDTANYIGDNTFATPDTLQPAFLNCQVGGNMPTPTADVWYKFVATAERLALTVSGFTTNVMTLFRFEGGCMTLIPIECALGNGPVTLYNDFMIVGEMYYLQVSGANTVSQGLFNMTFAWVHPCDDCMQDVKLMAFPPPVNGYYNPGDTVVFAYGINGYKAYGQDFLHGVAPTFGSGWDMGSLTTGAFAPPTPVSGNGSWNWYNNIPDENLNLVDGFFYDGPPLINSDPKDNKGDAGNQYSQWIFYWKIATKTTCSSPEDLSVYVLNYSDFQTGSGNNSSCKYDADISFKATLICCNSPDITIQDEVCPLMGTGIAAINIPGPTVSPWDCFVYDNAGNQIFASVNQASSLFIVSNLDQGDYVAITQDGTNGTCFGAKKFRISSAMDLQVFQTNAACSSACASAAMVLGQNVNSTYTYFWNPSNATGQMAGGLCPGPASVSVTNVTFGCTILLPLQITGLPPDDAFFEYLPPNGFAYCTVDTASPRPAYVAVPNGTFSWDGPPGNLNAQTGVINLLPAITAGTYNITYTTPGPCTNTSVIQVIFNQSPSIPLYAPVSSICADAQPITLTAIFPGSNTVIWADTLNFWSTLFTGNPYVLPNLLPGAYTYFVIYQNPTTQCFGYPNQINFNIWPLPLANAGLDTTICLGHSVTLNASGGANYNWSPPYGLDFTNIPNPNAMPDTTTTYVVIVSTVDGCSAADNITVNIVDSDTCGLVWYTGFSPNGDGHNDGWYIEGIGLYQNNIVQIFNRWGDMVWSHKDYDNRQVIWTGLNNDEEELPAGTYFFVINADDQIRKGWVEITR